MTLHFISGENESIQKSFSNQGNSKCRGAEMEAFLICSKNNKEASIARMVMNEENRRRGDQRRDWLDTEQIVPSGMSFFFNGIPLCCVQNKLKRHRDSKKK